MTDVWYWKALARELHGFGERWRDAGHLGEKAFEQMQALWKEANHLAHAPLEAAQKASLAHRHAMIEEAAVLGAAPQLRIDAVKALQQRWQAEAQSVPLDRKHEQKLWDAFRKPIDEAFNRKTAEREKSASALSDHDRRVLDAAKALEQANAGGDVQKIRAAIAALEAANRGQAVAAAAPSVTPDAAKPDGAPATDAAPAGSAPDAQPVAEVVRAADDTVTGTATQAPEPAAVVKPKPKPVVAVRGDDRPGMKKSEPAAPARGGKFGERKGAPPARFGERRGPDDRGADRGFDRGQDRLQDRGPRLGDAAFRAQREALERADMALRKLAAQAHGEVVTQLLTAWEQRAADQVPGQAQIGKALTPAARGEWVRSVSAAPGGDAGEALLRLEVAAELPTPAEQLSARRALQLQLLTRRNDPAPAQTWPQDAARVLATPFEAANARRLQSVLKALLRK